MLMKKKLWLIPVLAIGLIVILLIGAVGAIEIKGFGLSTGRYLEAKNSTAMIVLDSSLVRMANKTDKDLFGNLDAGDTILVIHDGIKQSYPGQTGVYAVCKLRDGTIDDIPDAVLRELMELGWLE